MNNQLEFLYKQIKEKKISPQDAIEQIKEFELQQKFPIESAKILPITENKKIVTGIAQDLLQEKTVNYFKKLLASVIKLPTNRIAADAPMEDYGIDSVMIMQLTNELEKTFGSLSKTLFFEYQTIESISEYFLESYQEQLVSLLGFEVQEESMTRKSREPITVTEPIKSVRSSRRNLHYSVPRIETLEEEIQETIDIAIIGLSGRYPGARNIQKFWQNLKEGKDCITEIPNDRWDYSLYFDADKNKPGKTYSKWGGFLDGVDEFDPLFFNISPREAEFMDPQERLFLECVYETLEDAGYTRETLGLHKGFGLEGNVGIYVGVMYEEYQLYGAQEQILGKPIALGGNPASIANRVSYFCNFHGPSMAVNTMCSSSLTAIHLACQSLQRGGCELALAGGVNVSIHPNKYLMLGQGKFVSSKGWCESFGEGGDGYVPGEGVGAVLLKPLLKAIADGDHIYGIIKGTAINHGGKTNGYSVPNPNAQASVIGQAIKVAGVDPRAISYIEAHGTGTSLGDPIEIAGLTKSFQEYTKDKQFCAIGSAKSNIGHCESAAGIAGLTKIILQLKHRQIAPSLHSRTLNPNIDFSNTPFIVQQELTEWKRPVIEFNGETREYPRIAGISSFGAGGSNAHIVIEEYVSKEQRQPSIEVTPQNPAVIVLSAKNKERLKDQAQRLLVAIVEQKFSELELADMAYTLQVGREAMEERLAIIVESIKDLQEKLKSFLKGQDDIEEFYRGQVKRNKETLAVFAADDDMLQTINAWISKRKYGKLLDLWVKGLVFDWNKLYKDVKPRRISLPAYPFDRERYWAPEINMKASNISALTTAIHPVLHQNTSDFFEQRFTSIFTGSEFFLVNHVVKGQRVMPGVVYLEMARAAVNQAAGILKEGKNGIRLRNIVWARPIAVSEQPVQVHIGLFPEDNGEITYEIYTEGLESDAEPVVHSQGSVVLSPTAEVPRLDIETLQNECKPSGLSSAQYYEVFKGMGIDYGPGHQGIERMYVGRNQVLAKLSLPASVLDTQDQFILHPSLMDSALQASIGLMISSKEAGVTAPLKLILPFALQELEIISKCVSSMWALIRYSADSVAGDKLQKIDIDLCDEQGNVCIRIKEFSSRIVEGELGLIPSAENIGTVILEPDWKEQAVQERIRPAYEQHVVFLCEADTVSRESIESSLNGVRCLSLKAEQEEIDKRFESYALQVFAEIKILLAGKPKGNVLVQIVTSGQGEKAVFAGLAGLLKTAQLENSKLIGQFIEFGEDSSRIIEIIKENSQSSVDRQIRYQEGKRFVPCLKEVEVSKAEKSIPWKDHGIYLITGGAGGLGQIFANEIAHTVKNATLVLTGRSPIGKEKEVQLKQLKKLGARVVYQQVDVTQKQAVEELLKSIREELGGLHGIIHSAGLLRDNFILKKKTEDLQAVLAPKVTGLVNLDQASKDLPLDFFILFSSMSGSLGNIGQADYSTANAFMDAYARYRNGLVSSNTRQGGTLSIGWPLWKDGGMHVDAETEKAMRQATGMIAMRTPSGIKVLYQGAASGKSQVIVMEGNVKEIENTFLGQPTTTKAVKIVSAIKEKVAEPAITHDALKEKTINYFKKLLSFVTKLPANKIETDAQLEDYGIDSVMIMQLTNQLEKTFGSLSKTLFFEYQTVEALTGYFLEAYLGQLMNLLGIKEKAAATIESAIASNVVTETVDSNLGTRRKSRFATLRTEVQKEKDPGNLEIAIIGLSGRYPGAKNVQEFWENLREGKDCITEIPKNRWNHSLYFDADKNKPGKAYSKWGGFLDGVDEFDPLFFNISPREAEYLDPQERLFLQCVYETLEDAGYTRETLGLHRGFGLEGNVGVYVGVMYEEYQLYGAQAQVLGKPLAIIGNPASIANRVSYFCNLHGPSMVVETMCSSSLTAIHLACQSLQRGGCELAIAGGVNVSIHPNKYLGLSQGKFVSSKGRCESFGEGGDGYVPGEGVGAVLLKPLPKAISDGDHIYGVIKGTAINHGGKTNGYSVPNPNAQASVVEQAIKEAGVNPRAISYIEAHGTGTSLGDPIEIAGLTKTFCEYTKDRQFCAIGSAKSNIGHCESAAGIAGLTKIILQLKHRQIAPSLHSRMLNSNINFADTPFVVQQELTEWKRPEVNVEGKEKEYPRIAGISAFGAGGANAHIIIEEYVLQKQSLPSIEINSQNPAMIVLSAKNEVQLKEQAQRLLNVISRQEVSQGELADIAYTLQVGRESMEERLAMVVESMPDLEEKLKGIIEGQDDIEDCYRGQVKRNKETLAVFAADEELQEAIEKWIQRRKYAKLLDLWVKGLAFDWNKLYGDIKPRRISLPTYPFAKERYWIPEMEGLAAVSEQGILGVSAFIHPLVHQNISNIFGLQFRSTFTGQEFFLADHVVKGQHILPGVAYLEMARVAAEQAVGGLEDDKTQVCLKNVAWVRPIVAEQPVRVQISLEPEDDGEFSYEIYSEEDVVHSQGSIVLRSKKEAQVLNLKTLQAECNQLSVTAAQCYEVFRVMGFEYGSGHQGIETLYVGADQVLAKLCLPASVLATQGQFILHPSLMDSALQASIGLMISSKNTNGKASFKPVLPFAIQELEIFAKCTAVMWTLIRYSEGSNAGDRVQKIDIDLCDEQGNICVQIKGFSSRVLEGKVRSAESTESFGTLILEPDWKEQPIIQQAAASTYEQHVVMLCETDKASKENIESSMSGVRCLILKAEQEEIDNRFQVYASQAFAEVQTMLQGKPKGKMMVQIVTASQGEQKLFSGLTGLLRTAQLENPGFIGQLIEVGESSSRVIEILKENSQSPNDSQIRYQDGKRFIKYWKEAQVVETSAIPWKDHGVYLITGGAGGLGRIFAKEIANKVKDATLVLTGRSPLSEEKKAQLKELKTFGARVVYQQVDVTQKQSVTELLESIQEELGGLHGIIHSAGLLKDSFILKKTPEELQAVMAPKVTGLVNLDEVSKELPLDFFILFSSMAGSVGNPGQADYSTANAFMDGYAQHRNALVAARQRQGRTLSISWPLWKNGGMQVGAEIEKVMKQSMGMIPMQTTTGIQILYQSVALGADQVMVLEGDVKHLRAAFLGQVAEKQPAKAPLSTSKEEKIVPAAPRDLFKDKTVNYFKKILSVVIKLPINRIDADIQMDNYGIDSIMVMQLTNELEKTFGSLSKTLFFEYQTIEALAGYFLEAHQEQLVSLLGIEENVAATLKNSQEKDAVLEEPVKLSLNTRRHVRFSPVRVEAESQEEKAKRALDIAIIGVSGRYPGARNIQEFLENLRAGKDCITEIPKERWDHSLYFDKDKSKLGKIYTKWGGFIEGVDTFDPLFFNISPREAEMIDPMVRLFMETVWDLFESAGYTKEILHRQYQSRVGVYVGAMYQQYQSFASDLFREAGISVSSYNAIANRVSHYFNLQGPSIAIDTMCSSSTVAIHMACESLVRGDCQLAIAGGVNLSISPKKYLGLSLAKMLGSHSDSRSFGDGDGFIPAEGVGAVLLKPLSKAIQDQDSILAVIKSTATNHGGHTNGYYVPNPNAQAQLMEDNFIKAGIDPRTISYVEAAANGSVLGDSIEVTALSKAFKKFTLDKQFCRIGSVKSNIGHAEAASGISQLTKVILQLQHKQLFPLIKMGNVNPNISFDNTPFCLQQELEEWKRPIVKSNGDEREYPRRATVSSFGAGGSNAHLIVEEYDPSQKVTVHNPPTNQPQIVIFSAKNPNRLQAVVEQMLAFVQSQKLFSLADFSYTLQVGREAMEYRAAMVVSSQEELIQGMEAYLGSVQENKEIEGTIPVFLGTMEEDYSQVKSLLSGKVGEAVLQVLLAEKKLEKIALYWVKGGNIPWQEFHGGKKVPRMFLPTYPFEKRRCWIEFQPEEKLAANPDTLLDSRGSVIENVPSVDNLVVDIIAGLLGVMSTEININKSLDQYGVNSIILLQLLQQLQTYVDPSLDVVTLQMCSTIKDIIHVLGPSTIAEPILLRKRAEFSTLENVTQFPELICFNPSAQGRPIFWIHGAVGGVEAYQSIAEHSERPFYGIQARGWLTEQEPLQGIQAMASYYVQMIRSVRPVGPYDLGGYSLGGILAYEVTRQLQEQGHVVTSIVMLDSIHCSALVNTKIYRKSLILQTINMAILSTTLHEPKKIAEKLIHQEEINTNIEDEAGDEEFTKQLIILANERGLKKTEMELRELIRQSIKVSQSYGVENYPVLPLLDSTVPCYYFRNKSGIFAGELRPYFYVGADEALLDHINYWDPWKQQLSNFYMMDVDGSNHFKLLSELKVKEVINTFCNKMYSQEGMPAEFFDSFIKKHGTSIITMKKKIANKKVIKKVEGNQI